MNGRFLPALSLVILVAGVANPRIAAPDPLPSEPPAPSSGVPVSPPVAPTPTEAYPAAIQTLLDRGGRLAGRGMVGDLPFWTIETPAGQQTYVTSPRGLVIQGQLYDSGGLLKLDTAAAVPVIADPARQRREGLQPLLGGTNTVLPPTAGLADGSPPAAARDDSLAAVETLIRGATGPEAVWADLGQATTIEEGARDAPLVYVFIDPYCPYCHQQWRLLRQTITDGRLRVRWVPVRGARGLETSASPGLGSAAAHRRRRAGALDDASRWRVSHRRPGQVGAGSQSGVVRSASGQ